MSELRHLTRRSLPLVTFFKEGDPMATDADRLAALEAWVDAVTPTLRGLVRRLDEAPVRDATGAPQAIDHVIPDGSERRDVLAAVPARTTQ